MEEENKEIEEHTEINYEIFYRNEHVLIAFAKKEEEE